MDCIDFHEQPNAQLLAYRRIVKHVCPVRTLVIERPNRRATGHATVITYQYQLEI